MHRTFRGALHVLGNDPKKVRRTRSSCIAPSAVRCTFWGRHLEEGATHLRKCDAPSMRRTGNALQFDPVTSPIEPTLRPFFAPSGIGSSLRRGRYPDKSHGSKIAAVLRKVADDLDA